MLCTLLFEHPAPDSHSLSYFLSDSFSLLFFWVKDSCFCVHVYIWGSAVPAIRKTGVNELKYQQLKWHLQSQGFMSVGCQYGQSEGLTPCCFQKASQYILKTKVTFGFTLLSKSIIWTYLPGEEGEFYTFSCVSLH